LLKGGYMEILKYVVMYIIFFVAGYVIYYFLVTNGQIKSLRGKSKKKKELSAELIFLKGYYHIDIEKIGMIKILRIVNFINALLFAFLVIAVIGISQIWLKLLIIFVVLVPALWGTYYLLAKYLKHLERKIDNV
jgi:protein-S-isoprenylcysteine O-methyltransferase Ste14